MGLKEHVRRAVDLHGSQAKLAERIGCSQQQISYLMKARRITADMALKLHEATDGAVSKHTLRPDIFGPDQSGSPSTGTSERKAS